MARTSGHPSRRVFLISSKPLARMIVVVELSLAMGVALVAFLASVVSLSPTTSAYAATSEDSWFLNNSR